MGCGEYPPLLQTIKDPPLVLFALGDVSLLQSRCVAVVGTRRASPYGRWAAAEIARKISLAGVTVVSGMAEGIDTAAHEGCLQAGGKTIAVFGTGVDICFPKSNAKLYEEYSLQEPVAKLTGGIIHFPSGYKLRKATDSFVWIADEKHATSQAVLIYKYPATQDAGLFTLDNIIATRNRFMQENVPGPYEGTYMTTATAFEPTMRYLRFHGREFVETRGFWDVYNYFMGGPFVSHSFYSQDGKDIIVMEAYVYAPIYDKRQYLREVESLLYSFEWKKDDK